MPKVPIWGGLLRSQESRVGSRQSAVPPPNGSGSSSSIRRLPAAECLRMNVPPAAALRSTLTPPQGGNGFLLETEA